MAHLSSSPTAWTFFHHIGAAAKFYAFLPGLGKYAPIERGHGRFDQALLSFLDQQ